MFSIRIDPDLKEEFNDSCFFNGTNMTDVLTDFIYKYVELSRKKGKVEGER